MEGNLVNYQHLFGSDLPLVCEPTIGNDRLDLSELAAMNRSEIEEKLCKYGGILFRNFSRMNAKSFQHFIGTISGETLEYRERSSPRSHVEGNIYTSTDYPAHQSIYLHNENSYASSFPRKVFFYCETASETGGETPIANVRNVFSRISEQTRNKLNEKGILYVRNFDENIGLSWKSVFQTESKEEVESYCKQAGYRCEWKNDNRLRVSKKGRVSGRHPITGENIWFNHATFFHITTLDSKVREAMEMIYNPDDLPNNCYYADGSQIELVILDELRAAYAAETIKFKWQVGDVLMLDNLLTAHAREPFTGPRKVLVGMSEIMNWDMIPTT